MNASLVAAVVLIIGVQMTLAQWHHGGGCPWNTVNTGSRCNAYTHCTGSAYCSNSYGEGVCCEPSWWTRPSYGWDYRHGNGWRYGGHVPWQYNNGGSGSGSGSNVINLSSDTPVCQATGHVCNDYTPCASGSYCSVSSGTGQCCSTY